MAAAPPVAPLRWEDAQAIIEDLTNVYKQRDDFQTIESIKAHRRDLDESMAVIFTQFICIIPSFSLSSKTSYINTC